MIKVMSTVALVGLMVLWGCGGSQEVGKAGEVVEISDVHEFRTTINDAGSQLLMFDFWASWCGPCAVLNPTIKNIAKQNPKHVRVFKVNTDRFPGLSGSMGVRGIPHVTFIKDGKEVHSLTGVNPASAYQRVIDRYK